MKKLLPLFLLIPAITMADCNMNAPRAMPLIRDGTCPSGYNMSGNYCQPNSNFTSFAVTRMNGCPSGYNMSGNYCVANSTACLAIPRSGGCPSGFSMSGNYCLAQ